MVEPVQLVRSADQALPVLPPPRFPKRRRTQPGSHRHAAETVQRSTAPRHPTVRADSSRPLLRVLHSVRRATKYSALPLQPLSLLNPMGCELHRAQWFHGRYTRSPHGVFPPRLVHRKMPNRWRLGAHRKRRQQFPILRRTMRLNECADPQVPALPETNLPPTDPIQDRDRYSRQVLFSGIGAIGQQRLAAAHVAIVGCGAMGAASASLLARAGIGTLTLIDRDFVEPSNLQRQALFDEADARESLPKAEAARRNNEHPPLYAAFSRTSNLEPRTCASHRLPRLHLPQASIRQRRNLRHRRHPLHRRQPRRFHPGHRSPEVPYRTAPPHAPHTGLLRAVGLHRKRRPRPLRDRYRHAPPRLRSLRRAKIHPP